MTKNNRETINRKQAAELLGIGINKLFHIIQHYPELGFPAQMNTGLMNQQYYLDEVLLFKETADYHNIKWIQPKRPAGIKLDKFDNELAVSFLSRPAIKGGNLTFADLVNKHCRSFGKSTTIHLHERNDYERPHPGTSFYRSGEHRVIDGIGAWL